MHTESATAPVVHVDRTTDNRRGRAATIFVDHARETPIEEVRAAAAAHLLPGEFLQGDCCRRSGIDELPLRFEYAVFS